MGEQEFTCCRGYVCDKVWPPKLAHKEKYIRLPGDMIKDIREFIKGKGRRVKTIRTEINSSQDYLLRGNLIKINPRSELPNIEIHAETEEKMEEIINYLDSELIFKAFLK